MATANPPPGAFAVEDPRDMDPFSLNLHPHEARHRYAAFDSSSLYLSGSPEQAERALQAHLAETTRRLQETSHLGNALVQQRQELEDRLKEVSEQKQANDIGPELRHKLAELEKEFNEVGRETARAFLPKSRVPSGESDINTGASVYTSEGALSPTKVSVPSRKQRNQQPSRINDIALATEISTSLLAQLKDLQAVLLEREEALKAANLDRSQLEIEVEGLSQRLRTLDESESRLKDVNWNLETQVHESEIQSKAAADREHRLNQSLNLARTEKATLEREFEELKQLYSKANEDLALKSKQHESELSGLRRNVSMGETERGALQRKMEELATQNTELARAVQHRMREEERTSSEDMSPDENPDGGNTLTPEHSPPPSPVKATPRHGQLESETLKHSLNHAHRMIQQLKNNIHREKTEKIELKRMLQDARDELESSRNVLNAPGSASKRRKSDKDVFKKPARPDRLGAFRTGSQEIVMEDDEWEEHEGVPPTPSRAPRSGETVPGAWAGFSSAAETSANEDFDTANETSDAAFETANERDGTATETDAFQTGAETLDGDSSDDLTETEGRPSTRGTIRQRPSSMAMAQRDAYESTASTSGDEWDTTEIIRTPKQSSSSRSKVKARQGLYRRSTPRGSFLDSSPAARDSPSSFVDESVQGTPAQGRSLFAELDALSGGESDGSVIEGTPSRSSVLSPESSPETFRKSALARSPLQSVLSYKPNMVDSGMMTEPWPQPAPVEASHISAVTSQQTEPQRVPLPVSSMSTLATQGTEPQSVPSPSLGMSTHVTQGTVPESAPLPSLAISTCATQVTMPQQASLPPLGISNTVTQGTEPREMPIVPLQLSALSEQNTLPLHAPLQISTVSAQDTLPQHAPPPSLYMSSVLSQGTTPESPSSPPLNMSLHATQGTAPLSPVVSRAMPPALGVSSIVRQATEPIESRSSSGSYAISSFASSISTQATEPIEGHETDSRIAADNLKRIEDAEATVAHQGKRIIELESDVENKTGRIEDAEATVAHQGKRIMELESDVANKTGRIEKLEGALKEHEAHAQELQTRERSLQASLGMSSLSTQASAPVETPQLPPLSVSGLFSQDTVPIESPRPAPSQLSTLASQITEPMEAERPAPSQVARISHQVTEPIAPAAPSSTLSPVSQHETAPVAPTPWPSQLSLLMQQSTEPVTSPVPTLSRHWSLVTEPVQPPRSVSPQLSVVSHQATAPQEAIRHPWNVGTISSQHTEPVDTRVPPTQHGYSTVTTLHSLQPESPTLPNFLSNSSRPSTATRAPASISTATIVTQETEPAVPSRPQTAHRTAPLSLLAPSTVAQIEARDEPQQSGIGEKLVSVEQAPSTVQQERRLEDGYPFPKQSEGATSDEGTQTMVSAEQIDRLLLSRSHRLSGAIAAAGVEKNMSPPASPGRTPRRPGSSSSIRSRAGDAPLPPLPADHKEVIAAAALKSPPPMLTPTTPVASGTMGPPSLPASAYKNRPQTPSIRTKAVATSPRIGGTTPRPRRPSQTRSGATSPITRRSSMSSFSSEIDHRFNIPGGMSFSQTGFDPSSTDPRMIQAITQTMCGEFLWKYTRKAGRETMSETRHRRFFWVHPYTRTLYWSEHDPQTAGRAQLKAKSVAIQSVHEVSDDNPLPPGLHIKSLVVVSPGRTIKFTATTSQRHETWFNALLYLLKRTDEGEEAQSPDPNEIQSEFNGAYRSSSRQTGRSRASYATHNSQRTSSPFHGDVPTLRPPPTSSPIKRPVSTEPEHGTVGNRFSSMLRSSSAMRGSFSSRFSRVSAHEGVTYEEPNTSAADLSRELVEANERAADRLVDVRACCDGE